MESEVADTHTCQLEQIESRRRLEAGKMPALPGSDRANNMLIAVEDRSRHDAGTMPALPGSDRANNMLIAVEDRSR
ncbi:MAG: hypothetical protein K2X77_32300, partial [Candidatus Obscuribacterales bacterium]|nr:hypothetical protein [Candidatus Obscuribacterales bacterium]